MTDDPYNLSRFDDLRPGLDFVVFDPDAEGGLRAMTADESARLRDAVRTPSERMNRTDEPIDTDGHPEVDHERLRDHQRGDHRAPEIAPAGATEPVAELDEQAWRDRLGLDEPNRIPRTLEPPAVAEPTRREDDELER